MGEITFFSEGIRFGLSNEEAIRRWILSVLEIEDSAAGEINYIFCHDDYLLDLNKEYLGHDAYTDIVTFDLGEDESITGDIFISIDRVKENAEELGVPFENELQRVVVHGILHLLGYGDKTEAQKKKMRAKEDECLNLLENK